MTSSILMIFHSLGRKPGRLSALNRSPSHAVTTSLTQFFHGLLDLVDGLLGDLLDLADRLVGLALRAKLVIAGQRAGSFLEPAFHHVCLATHDGVSCS